MGATFSFAGVQLYVCCNVFVLRKWKTLLLGNVRCSWKPTFVRLNADACRLLTRDASQCSEIQEAITRLQGHQDENHRHLVDLASVARYYGAKLETARKCENANEKEEVANEPHVSR